MYDQDIPILLVEDDDVDVENVTRAFDENGISNPLFVARHGEEALRLVAPRPRGFQHPDPIRPGLILLDINMPIMNGIELLGHLKGDPALCTIPVVVLTTSQKNPIATKASWYSLWRAIYQARGVRRFRCRRWGCRPLLVPVRNGEVTR